MSTAEVIPPKVAQRWSAEDYARNGRFVSELAHDALDLLAPKRGERILDLGCGDGALTEKIAASGVDVLGSDVSEELLAAPAAKGLKVQSVDGHALPFKTEWALKPNGRFVGEFGGHGDVAAIATALRAIGALHGGDPARAAPWFFPSVAEYGRLLEQGGFVVKSIMLGPRPTALEIGMQGWLETFESVFLRAIRGAGTVEVLAEVLDLLRPALCDANGVWITDHTRLRFFAERNA